MEVHPEQEGTRAHPVREGTRAHPVREGATEGHPEWEGTTAVYSSSILLIQQFQDKTTLHYHTYHGKRLHSEDSKNTRSTGSEEEGRACREESSAV